MDIKIRVEENDVPQQMRRASNGVEDFFEEAADHFVDALGRHAPRKSNELSESFFKRKLGGHDYAISSTAEHAEMVRTGTGEYGPTGKPIMPTDKKALKFHWDKAGTMTVWRGMPNRDAKGRFAPMSNFSRWATWNNMMPFGKWPKGMPGRDYVSDAQDDTERSLHGILIKELKESGAS